MEESDLYPPVLLPQTVPPPAWAVYLPLGGGAGEQAAGLGASSSSRNINIAVKFAFGLMAPVFSVGLSVGDGGGVSRMLSVLTGTLSVCARGDVVSAKARQSISNPMQDCSLERNIIGLPGQSNRDAGSGKMVRMASRGGLKYGQMAWGASLKKVAG
jgi:hypothetical protein